MSKLTRSQFIRRAIPGLITLGIIAACNNSNNASNSTTTSQGQGSGGKVLKVATEPAFPPFESQGAGGELEGFDIDLMKAIGEEAGFTVEFQSLPFDGIIPALQAGTVDAAISGMTITAERQKTVTFSRPYFKAGLAIAVRENNTDIRTIDDLKDKRIAVQIGTTGAEKAKSIAGSKISTFDSAPLALQELSNNNVDAVVNDGPVTLYAINSGGLKGLKVVGELVTEEFYGIAMPKDSANAELINQGLTKLKENGRYAEIYKKWFNAEPPTLPETAPVQ